MSERYVRLAGPYAPTTDPVNQDVLFTVPDNKLFVIRDAALIGTPLTGVAGATPTLHMAVDGRDLLSVDVTPVDGIETNRFTGSQPIQAGETVTAYIDGVATTISADVPVQPDLTDGTNVDYTAVGSDILNTPTSCFFAGYQMNTGATVGVLTTLTPQTSGFVNLDVKKTQISARGPVDDVAVSVSVATLDVLTDFDVPQTVRFTWNAACDETYGTLVQIDGVPYPLQVAQSASATGTTSETATVTMTPISSDNLQFLVVYGEATAGGAWGTPTNGTLIESQVVGATSSEYAVFVIDPPATNPTSTWTVNNMDSWSAVAIEVVSGAGGSAAATISGLVIE